MSAPPTQSAPPHPSAGNSFQMVAVMGGVSLICGLLIVITYQATAGAIRQNLALIMQQAVVELVPGTAKQVIYGVEPSGELTVLPGVDADEPKLFAAYDSAGRFLGVVAEASERGYADVIRALYACAPETQQIVGFKVLDLKETPGLGDLITRDPDFLANFEGLDASLDTAKQGLAHPIKAVKHGKKQNPWEVDAIAGATISSKAVGRMLNKSAQAMAPIIQRNLARIQKGE